MTQRGAAGVPVRPLAALTLAVLLVHGLLLQARPGVMDMSQTQATGQLITRLIAPAAARKEPPPDAGIPAEPAAEPQARAAAQPAQSLVAAPSPAVAPTPLPAPAPAAIAAATPPAPPTQAAPFAAAPPAAGPEPAGSQDAAPALAAFAIPGSVRLRYVVNGELHRLAYQASATLAWRQDGATYEARLEVNAFPLKRQQTSVGRITAQGLAPVRFSDRVRSEQAAHFERDKGRISFSSNAPDAPLQAGAQDRLSVLLQLGAMIGAAPARFGAGTSIAVQTASTREADVWHFNVAGPETLLLPGGETRTLKLVRLPRHEHDQKVELWLAPTMDYLPVRLRLTQPGGDFADQQWQGTDRG